jgi:hypothetical protein
MKLWDRIETNACDANEYTHTHVCVCDYIHIHINIHICAIFQMQMTRDNDNGWHMTTIVQCNKAGFLEK